MKECHHVREGVAPEEERRRWMMDSGQTLARHTRRLGSAFKESKGKKEREEPFIIITTLEIIINGPMTDCAIDWHRLKPSTQTSTSQRFHKRNNKEKKITKKP